MADWYVSSAAYAAMAAFVPSAVYSVGNIVKPTAPALKAQWAFRCTVAGTASTEPAWPTADNSTIVTGGATFANVTGQSAYGWAAAAGDIPTLFGAVGAIRTVAGDRMFVSSDHAEVQTSSSTFGQASGGSGFGLVQVLSVNRAGSVPPASGDLLAGATITNTLNSMTLEALFPIYWYGFVFVSTGTLGVVFGTSGSKTIYLDACQIYLNSVSTAFFAPNNVTVILNNSTLRVGAVGQAVRSNTNNAEWIWLNTPSAIAGGTIPSTLFLQNTVPMSVTARGVDFSAITGTLVAQVGGGNPGSKYLFDSCRIASGVTRYNNSNVVNTRDLVELVNCFDGTNIINESYQPAGSVVTERTITLSGGATDDVGTFSLKLVSGTNIDKYVNPLLSFWMDVEQTAVGSGKTATVEIISSLTLNNDDISLLLEYQGTAGSPVASFANTLPTNVLTTNAAVTASTATWNSQPATPQKQKLQVAFTPQLAGRVRGQVRLGKASTTVYVNPMITVT